MFSRPVCIKHDWGTKYLKQSGQRRKGKGRLKGIGIYLDNLANGWRSLQSLTTPDLDFSITCDMCKRRWVLHSMFPLSNKTNVGDWKMVFKRCTKFLTHLRSFCSAFSAREIFCFLTHLRSFCSAFSAREIFCLSRSCLSPYRVWNININNSWSVFLFSDHADLVDCVCWYFAEGAEMYKLLNLRAELFLCTVSTTALLIYAPRVISELAYFQVAIKLLYSFQLVIERMSSLSSLRQNSNRFIKMIKTTSLLYFPRFRLN